MRSLSQIHKQRDSKPHSDLARGGHLVLRRAAYTAFLLTVFFGSFLVTLWLTEPQVPKALDNRSDAERLAAYPISDLSGLTKSAQGAKLTLSRRLLGWVDAIYRTDDRTVGINGWAVDPEGGSTPLEVLIFVAGQLVATSPTSGERPDVTTQKNVGFSTNFTCRKGDQPIVVVLGKERQYMPLHSAPCP
jgi:hypothetical protein